MTKWERMDLVGGHGTAYRLVKKYGNRLYVIMVQPAKFPTSPTTPPMEGYIIQIRDVDALGFIQTGRVTEATSVDEALTVAEQMVDFMYDIHLPLAPKGTRKVKGR